MGSKSGNLAIQMIPQVSTEQRRADPAYMKLVLALQTSLEVESLLRIFSQHLQVAVPHSGYEFTCAAHDIDMAEGQPGNHEATYTLRVEGETLGNWRITRERRFRSLELEKIEDNLCHLLHPLRNALRYHAAISSAQTDPLTQVGNRACLTSCLKRELELARRYNRPISLIFLDIDHFKPINDSFGHAAGDLVIRKVAQVLKETVRASDAVFRYGGEEFVVLLSDTQNAGAAQLAERLRVAVAALQWPDELNGLNVTISLGVATYANGPYEQFMDLADQAMYAAKMNGRNRVEIAPLADCEKP